MENGIGGQSQGIGIKHGFLLICRYFFQKDSENENL